MQKCESLLWISAGKRLPKTGIIGLISRGLNFTIMRVISRKTLRDFWDREPAAEAELRAWFAEAEHADWKKPIDIKRKYGNASFLKGERVVFNICGNKYRLVTRINYQFGIVYIRFVGTHSDYDEIDAETI